MTVLSSVNIFARDLDSLVAFYAGLFGLREHLDQRGPIYRALDGSGTAIGFHAAEAYALLNLDEFRTTAGVKSLLTFEVADQSAVARLTAEAVASGATVVKAPYDTFYGSRQSVLFDPEGNVFRINAFQRAVWS
jgi:predicted enzyme related to lactoylglutathione lyase